MVCGTAGLDFVFVLSFVFFEKCFGGFGGGANARQTSSAAEAGAAFMCPGREAGGGPGGPARGSNPTYNVK